MNLEFTAEQEELRNTVRGFLSKECPMTAVRRLVEEGGGASGLWQAMVGLDWPGLAISEEYGGIGLGFTDVAVVAEELGAAVAPGPFLPIVTQFVPAVRETGSGEQQRRFLSPVAAGAATGALALADDPRCWRMEDVTARAARAPGGWALSGTKHAVMAGPDVDELVVAARIAEEDRTEDESTGGPALGLFVVPGSAVGMVPVRSVDATRPLSTVTLAGVIVTEDRVLGTPGGPEVVAALTRAVEEATTALAVETVGTCRALFDLVTAYAKERHQFGVAIGSFQAVKHKLADAYISLERARSLCYFAVAAIAEDHPERATATSMAKAAADDCQQAVCRSAIQTFGGIAFTWEHDAHLYVKRAMASGALFGKGSDHRLTIARAMGVTSP